MKTRFVRPLKFSQLLAFAAFLALGAFVGFRSGTAGGQNASIAATAPWKPPGPYIVPPTLLADMKAAHDALDAYWAANEKPQAPSDSWFESPVGYAMYGYAKIGDVEKAIQIQNKYTGVKMDESLYLLAASVQFRAGNKVVARGYMDKLLALKPDPGILGDLGAVLCGTDEMDLLNTLLSTQDVETEPIVEILMTRRDFARAAEWLARDKNSQSQFTGYGRLARAEYEAGKTDAALGHYKDGIAAWRRQSEDRYVGDLGNFVAGLALSGDVDGAIQTVKQNRSNGPDFNAEILLHVVCVLVDWHQLDKASKVADAIPDCPTIIAIGIPRLCAYAIIADARITAGDKPGAAASLKQAFSYLESLKKREPINLGVDDLDAYLTLVEMQNRAGDSSGAQATKAAITASLVSWDKEIAALPDIYNRFMTLMKLCSLQRWNGNTTEASATIQKAETLIASAKPADAGFYEAKGLYQGLVDTERNRPPAKPGTNTSYIRILPAVFYTYGLSPLPATRPRMTTTTRGILDVPDLWVRPPEPLERRQLDALIQKVTKPNEPFARPTPTSPAWKRPA